METVGLLILMIIILGGGYLLTGSLDTLLDHLTIIQINPYQNNTFLS